MASLRKRAKGIEARLVKWQSRVDANPGDKAARKALRKAQADMRELSRETEREHRRIQKEAEKRKRERDRLRKEVEENRRKQQELLRRAWLEDFTPGQPNLADYPNRGDVGDFLDDKLWDVYRFPSNKEDWNAMVDFDWTPGQANPMSEWIERDNVWWRADVDFIYPSSATGLLRDMGEDKKYLYRGGEAPKEIVVSYAGGTGWHRDPALLDVTVSTFIDNFIRLRESTAGKPKRIRVKMQAVSRAKRPEPVKRGGRLCQGQAG